MKAVKRFTEELEALQNEIVESGEYSNGSDFGAAAAAIRDAYISLNPDLAEEINAAYEAF